MPAVLEKVISQQTADFIHTVVKLLTLRMVFLAAAEVQICGMHFPQQWSDAVAVCQITVWITALHGLLCSLW